LSDWAVIGFCKTSQIHAINSDIRENVIIKSTTYWDVMPCGLVEVHQYFRKTQCLHQQGERSSQARNQPSCLLLLSGFMLGSFSEPEDEGSMFLWNVSWLLSDYTVLHLWRQYSSVNTVRTSIPATGYCNCITVSCLEAFTAQVSYSKVHYH
jgi:hypothetical protein